VFERVDLTRDLHFYTKTTLDTLDYSGDGINEGSKLVVAAYGEKIRDLRTELPGSISGCDLISQPVMLMEGVLALMLHPFSNYNDAQKDIKKLTSWIIEHKLDFEGVVQIVIYDDFKFVNLNDYVWLTYTRSNPSHDIYGVEEVNDNKHWGCKGPMIIDARKKPHHAPELKPDPVTEENIRRFFMKGASLEKWA
jgi:4-hydroxy-3-polyprenylbenzoate decarboxylase